MAAAAAAGLTMTSLTDAVTSSVDVMTSSLVVTSSAAAAAAAAVVRDTWDVMAADSMGELQAAAYCRMMAGLAGQACVLYKQTDI